MSEELESQDLKEYIEATAASSSRGRRVLIVMITASVLAFGAFWNSRQDSWINSRLRVASAAQKWLALNKEYFAPGTTEERKNELQREIQDRAYEEPREFIRVRSIQTTEELEPLIKKLRDIQTENVMYIHVPFFGVLFDVNDLGMLGGFAFVVLLMWLRFNLWHESSNLKITFAEPEEKYRLYFCYESLAMQQVLTVPSSLESDQPRQRPWSKVTWVLFFLPFSVQAIVFSYDAYSFAFGATISLFNTILSLAVSLAWLVVIGLLTYFCVDLSREINRTWKTAFDQLSLKGKTVFKLRGYAKAKAVALAGSFNNWNSSQFFLTRQKEAWVYEMNLAPGEYRYKFVIDGNWIHDPANSTKEDDGEGNMNSLLVVK